MTTTSTEVQGIPTLLAPRSGDLVAAGLVFRVGRADETLATAGITHLVEHLALHQHGLSDLHYNGQTADTYTHFHVEGTTAHVVEYLNGVCAALRDLPVERLEVEKQILRTEESGRSSGPSPNLPLYRYGAQGHGLPSYAELGLHALDAEAVRAWAAERFTRDNAVLWITTGSVPDGLDLALPPGRRMPVPPVTSTLPQTPAWFPYGGNVVVLQGIVERSTAATLFTHVLSRALFRDLRQKGGFSYTATAEYVPRDNRHAAIYALADSAPDKREAVVGGLVDTLARLRLGTIEQSELEAARSAALSSITHPDAEAGMLPGRALNLLIDYPDLSRNELVAQIEATTVADLRGVAEEVHATALAQVPVLGLDWAGFAQAPEWSTSAVTGTEFRPLDADAGTLVVGPAGASIVHPAGASTVHFADAVALEVFGDGGRRLYGRDGFTVPIEPTMHRVDDATLALIDRSVRPSVVVRVPARDPDRIPRPQAPAPGRPPAGRRDVFAGIVRTTVTVVTWMFASLMLITAIVSTVDFAQHDPDTDLATVIILWVVALGLLAVVIRRSRR